MIEKEMQVRGEGLILAFSPPPEAAFHEVAVVVEPPLNLATERVLRFDTQCAVREACGRVVCPATVSLETVDEGSHLTVKGAAICCDHDSCPLDDSAEGGSGDRVPRVPRPRPPGLRTRVKVTAGVG
jgi:hypothetical protein